MIRLLSKKQIYTEGGCMQDSVRIELNTVVDLMDYIPELIALVVILLMFISTIWIGFEKAKRSYEKKRGLK